MTMDDDDAVLRMLARLPAAVPDPERAERVVARCRAAMRQRKRRDQGLANAERRVARAGRRLLEPIVIGAVSLTYLVAVVYDVLRWHGMAS